MRSREVWVGVLVTAVGLAGCGDDRSGTPQGRPNVHASRPVAVTHDRPSGPAAVDQSVDTPFGLGDSRDVDGIRVTREPSGRITVRGNDRWGRPIDVTYEDETYFRNAVPTFALSVSETQAAKLRTLSEHITPTAPAAPSPSRTPPPSAAPSGQLAPSGARPTAAAPR